MKKYLSLILVASLSLSAVASTAVFAEGTETATPALNNMVVLGDSIASGYGLDENEYSYAELCADYFGCNLDNFATEGLSSAELLKKLQSPSDEQKEAIANSDVIVVSIGGNDMIHYGAKQALSFASAHGLLAEGYTEADIPEDPGIWAMNNMIDKKAFKDYANSGLQATLALNTELRAFSSNLRLTEGNNAYGENKGIIQNEIMANISETVNAIKEINPEAQVIVQTVYQPFQFSPKYIEENYGKNSGYASMLTQFRSTLNDVMVSFREELNDVEGIEVVDVLQAFTGLEDIKSSSDATPGYAYYFTDIQEPTEAEEEGGKTMDFHPNKKGHVAIASALLSKIKVKNTETGELVSPAPATRETDPETGKETPTLISATIDSIEDISECPPLTMEQIVETLPDRVVPGDVNNDGIIDSVDGAIILSEYANLSTIDPVPELDEEASKRADINYDGLIDSSDATYALMYYVYSSTLQEGEETLNIFEFLNKQKMESASK